MSQTDLLSPPPVGPGAHDHAMRWLAQRLRQQRLSLLVVPPGLDIHALLKQRLMLLLGRRDSDVDLLAGPASVAAGIGTERRQRRQSETTAFFDDWAQMARSGALDWRPPGDDDRVLLVMPGLGACLQAAASEPAARRWLQALVQGYWGLDQALGGRAQRPVQVLLAIDEAQLPLLDQLQQLGLPVDELLLRWQADGSLRPATPEPPAPAAATRPAPGGPSQPAVPAAPAAATPAQAGAAPSRSRALWSAPRWAGAVLLLATTGLLALTLGLHAGPPAQPSRPAALQLAALDVAATTPTVAGPATAARPWPLMVAATPAGLPPAVVDLAGRIGPSAGLWLAPQLLGDWAEGLHRLQAGPGLLVLRYDALLAARQADARLAPRLLTPLYTEPLLAIVQAGSPLASLQQLRGQRVRVAAAGSADAHSASALLQALFGTAAPAVLHAAAGAAPSLPQADDEVLLTVGRPGRPWTDALPPGLQARYRLLPFNPGLAGSQQALQQHLPLQVDGPGGPVNTLGVMSFLATSPTAASGPDQDAALQRLAQALCRELPTLQHSGDAAWRGWQPGQQLTSGWPAVAGTAAAWRDCGQAPPPAGRSRAWLADARLNTDGDARLVSTPMKGQP